MLRTFRCLAPRPCRTSTPREAFIYRHAGILVFHKPDLRPENREIVILTFLGSMMSSGRPPLFPSSGSADLDWMTSEAFARPLTRKSAVFVAPLGPPDGRPAASLKLLTVRGSLVVHENPCARASPPKTRQTVTSPFAATACPEPAPEGASSPARKASQSEQLATAALRISNAKPPPPVASRVSRAGADERPSGSLNLYGLLPY
jgi:hypothetical protein